NGFNCRHLLQRSDRIEKKHHQRLVLNQGRPHPAMLRFNSNVSNSRLQRIRASASTSPRGSIAASATVVRESRTNPSEDNLEQWMTKLVTEIVKSLTEGPLLVHVFTDKGRRKRLETKEATDQWDWRRLSEK
ncbi:hypothetical protein LINPERHAP1_LOCUS30238, partial [Linum perenne]